MGSLVRDCPFAVKFQFQKNARKPTDMEFKEKLQELRKRRGFTQEELAGALYVSRTAVSKWESGRGVPNIESLKAISKYFSVSIDDLLSGEEILTIADEDNRRKQVHTRDMFFGLLVAALSCFCFCLFSDNAAMERSGKYLYFRLQAFLRISGFCT